MQSQQSQNKISIDHFMMNLDIEMELVYQKKSSYYNLEQVEILENSLQSTQNMPIVDIQQGVPRNRIQQQSQSQNLNKQTEDTSQIKRFQGIKTPGPLSQALEVTRNCELKNAYLSKIFQKPQSKPEFKKSQSDLSNDVSLTMNHPVKSFKNYLTPEKKRTRSDDNDLLQEPEIKSSHDVESHSTDISFNSDEKCCSKWNWEIISSFNLPSCPQAQSNKATLIHINQQQEE